MVVMRCTETEDGYMEPTLKPSVASFPDEPRKLIWTYSIGEFGDLRLVSHIETNGKQISVYFDFVRNSIVDESGQEYPKIEFPNHEIIEEYLNEVKRRDLPETFKNGLDILCLVSHTFIQFKDGKWTNKINGQKIYGFRSPY